MHVTRVAIEMGLVADSWSAQKMGRHLTELIEDRMQMQFNETIGSLAQFLREKKKYPAQIKKLANLLRDVGKKENKFQYIHNFLDLYNS